VEGKVSTYVLEEEEWVATVKDAPFGIDDAIYSDKGGRAEIIMPNNTWVRIDRDTRIQLIALGYDVTEIDMDSGVARFYNKGSDAVIKARTAFGYVMASGDTTFDMEVGDESVEVVVLEGTVYFVHSTSETKFEVIAGSTSIVANGRQVIAGEAHTDPYWHAWNRKRDALWAKRMRVKGKSVKYLPPRLHHDAYVLEEHGRWERVYYHGAYHYFWRPLYVSVGWAPFTVGRWVVWYEDHTWIPHEPFGYVTHHYGNWVFVGGFWYWAPPVSYVRVHIGRPLVNIGFAWYPGRVAWIHFGVHVGWVPLAPWEPYYCHHHWGPRVVTVKHVNITKIKNLNIHKYKHFKHAVVIHKRNLYNVKSYRKIRIRNINGATIRRHYRVVPVVSHKVIKNYRNMRKKHHVTHLPERRKPHRMAVKKIHKNESAAERHAKVRAKRIRENVRHTERGRIAKGARIRPRKVKDRVVPGNQANRSVSRVKFKKRELKREARLHGENQRQVKREVQKRWRKMPSQRVPQRKERGKNQGHVRSEGQMRQSKMARKPLMKQPVQQEEGPARGNLRKGRGRIPRRPEQRFQKRPGQRAKSQGKRFRRRHPGQQQQGVQRRQYSGREYSPRLPKRTGAGSVRSRVGPAKNSTRTRNRGVH
jgi:hypothetical protein